MDKAYMWLALNINISGGSLEASLVDYKRSNGDECLRIGALSLINVAMQASKVVYVFVGDNVPVNTFPSYPRGRNRDGTGRSMRT